MAHVKTGDADIRPDVPSHVKGIKQGNSKGNYESMPGHNRDGTSTARRSTGIDPKDHDPIDPRMPNISPA
jgi:hypothetical protein